jgi:hypothetical protein
MPQPSGPALRVQGPRGVMMQHTNNPWHVQPCLVAGPWALRGHLKARTHKTRPAAVAQAFLQPISPGSSNPQHASRERHRHGISGEMRAGSLTLRQHWDSCPTVVRGDVILAASDATCFPLHDDVRRFTPPSPAALSARAASAARQHPLSATLGQRQPDALHYSGSTFRGYSSARPVQKNQ